MRTKKKYCHKCKKLIELIGSGTGNGAPEFKIFYWSTGTLIKHINVN